MLAQRGGDIVRKTERTSQQSAPKKLPPAPQAEKRRMTFNDKHALETLPKQMAALQHDIAALQKRLDDPNLYVRDRGEFSRVSEAIAVKQSELATAEERWLELEILREELEQQ
jgi:ABC transport system ATP-binding/permease protein